MPRVAQRQKNKPFKAKSKGSQDRKKSKATTKTKSIAKVKGRAKNTRATLINLANEHLDTTTKTIVMEQLKYEEEIKIVVLVPGNKDADTHILIKELFDSLQGTANVTLKTDFKGIPYPVLQVLPSAKTFIKNKLMIISGESNNKKVNPTSTDIESLMDIIKCADIICPVLSCKSTNIQEMGLDPHEKGGAFDDFGYSILNMIRSTGTPTIIGIIQDLKLHEQKHHDKIERLFKRFISSELG